MAFKPNSIKEKLINSGNYLVAKLIKTTVNKNNIRMKTRLIGKKPRIDEPLDQA